MITLLITFKITECISIVRSYMQNVLNLPARGRINPLPFPFMATHAHKFLNHPVGGGVVAWRPLMYEKNSSIQSGP